MREFTTEIEFDPQELEELNARLTLISALKRKYGESIEVILAYLERAKAEVSSFEQRDERLVELRKERDALHGEARRLSEALSEKRRKAARTLVKQITAALS